MYVYNLILECFGIFERKKANVIGLTKIIVELFARKHVQGWSQQC